ncbi:MAG: hypothetical protein R3330_10675 [Saprospiraceae bacterium]|nr:hypothetical protein [Saprospiraceae bacterium]
MMKIRTGATLLVVLLVSGCSDSPDMSEADKESAGFPSGPDERALLTGSMSFWMYEGSAGCYGTLETGGQSVSLWVDADSCGEREYHEGESASVEVTFNPDNQYGPGKTYTITRFD